ncbi:MAG TPA: lytic transglycosylase domain-containing protein [Candidatus Acidoferrales bacterium]|nr:lytic transglycosylase domain-containing protein [Candidatus Acidoferrales bacterium]
MDIASEIAAVQSRIAEITGTPQIAAVPPPASAGPDGLPRYGPGATPPAAAGPFASLVAAALERAREQGYIAGAPPDARGPNPVAPAAIEQLVERNAATWQVDPALIKAVIANESAFDSNATSSAGAMGLMQLMPGTASELGVANAYDPGQNVAGGTRYLKGLLQRFNGDLRLAVAAYNAGPQAVEKYGGVPPYAETQSYVTSVLGSYARYRATTP